MAEESSTAVLDAPSPPAVDTPAAVPDTPVGVPSVDTPPSPPTPTPPRADPPVELRSEPHQEPRAEPTPVAVPEPRTDDTLLNWRDLADPEYRDDPVMKKYETVGAALKALVHSERMLGNSIQIPKDGAGETQWRTIFEKLGCPKSPGEYTISDPDMGKDEDGNVKGLAPNFLVSLLDVAHRAGLNNKQAQEFVNFAARTVVQSEHIQAGQMAMQKAEAERTLFEAFAGDAASMIQKATMAISRLGEGRYGGGVYAQRAAEEWRNSPLGNSVNMVAALANLWDNMGEGKFVESSAGGGMQTRDAIEADIQAFGAIMNDEKKPMAEREQARQKQYRLYQDLNAMQDAEDRRRGMGMR